MPAERLGANELPTNVDGFKTSRARYEFNIDRLAKKYAGAAGQSDVEIDLRTFDMTGTNKDVKKEFKRLAEIGEKFSFATMSTPVVNAAELESPQLAAKCLVLNDIFRSKHKGSLGLPAPHTRMHITDGATGESPFTRTRSKAMLEEPSTSTMARGDGTPMRPVEGRGARKSGEGLAVVSRGDRTMAVPKSRGAGLMMMEDDEPAASGIVVRPNTVMGAMMGPDAGNSPAAPVKSARKVVAMEVEDDAASGYGKNAPEQRTPPNIVAIEQPISSRTRQRTRLSLGVATPPAAIAAPAARRAIAAASTAALAPTAAKKTAGRRVSMPVRKWSPQPEEKGGRKGSQTRDKQQEEVKERKRSAEDTPKEVPKKLPRVITPKVSTGHGRVKKEIEEKDAKLGTGRIEAKGTNSSVQLVGLVYKDATTGRELVCEPESPSKKKNRIESWIEDSFNRTVSDAGSLDDSAGPSTSAHSAEWEGDFEKDKDVESFGKSLRRIASNARSRNSNMKMGMVDCSGQRRSTSSQGTQGTLHKNT